MPTNLMQILPLAMDQTFGPVIVSMGFIMIPIIAIWTKHQQKMAMIQRESRQAGPVTDTEARILQELAALRELVSQQALIVDDLASSQRARVTADDESIRQRIGR